jgi:hypothetical protein
MRHIHGNRLSSINAFRLTVASREKRRGAKIEAAHENAKAFHDKCENG